MKRIVYIAAVVLAASCGTEAEFDAQGTFEATEVVVSSEATGRILNCEVEEENKMQESTKQELDQHTKVRSKMQTHRQAKAKF